MPNPPSDSKQITAHIDGGSRGNPGPAAYAVVVSAADGTLRRSLVQDGAFGIPQVVYGVVGNQDAARQLGVAFHERVQRLADHGFGVVGHLGNVDERLDHRLVD